MCSVACPSRYPTRLLDVGSEASPHIRLRRTDGKATKYVALSHCWGNGPTLTTKLNNLAMRKDDIDFATLPQLFQDSVSICRKLGLRYLWIDSLTIIQDSKHDWEVESQKMGSIYENAYFVISAVECANSGQTILGRRQASFGPNVLEFENTVGKSFRVVARRCTEHHANKQEKSPATPNGPLNSRAWSLQEQALCSRIFHFTSSEIIFESCDLVCCECRPNPQSGRTTPGILSKIIAKQPKDKLFAKWHNIVNAYTLRNLSFPSDRLPAISGMAEKFQSATKSGYLAGLWLDNLVEDLLWSTATFLQNPHLADRLQQYRAPSFSWASVESQTHYEAIEPGRPLRPSSEILTTSCTATGVNRLGEVSNGYIRLRAPALQGMLIATTEHSFHYYLSMPTASAKIEVCPDSLLVHDDVLCTVRRAENEEDYRPFKAKVMCVCIATASDQCAYALVLGNASREPEAWERLGMFSCDARAFQDVPRKEIWII